jgi:hypothetical protein
MTVNVGRSSAVVSVGNDVVGAVTLREGGSRLGRGHHVLCSNLVGLHGDDEKHKQGKRDEDGRGAYHKEQRT